jgi:plastocyanin
MIGPRRVLPVLLVAAVGVGAGATTATAKTVRINLGDDFFSPSTKSVKQGAKLKFVWTGEDLHNVKATGAATKTSKFQKSGTFSFKAKKKGTIALICEVHEEDMTGSITVK